MKHQGQEQDYVIEAHRTWWSIPFRELWQYRDLIQVLVWRDFVSTYRQTVLGPLWHVIQPILTTLTYTIVFAGIAGVSTGGAPPVLFYLAGTSLWTYFAVNLTSVSGVFISNAHIFGKIYFPRLCIPVSIAFSNLIALGIRLGLLYILAASYGVLTLQSALLSLLYLPVAVFSIACFSQGLGMIVASLTTKYRDLQQALTFGVQLMMFFTPVIYPKASIPTAYRVWFQLNPLTEILEGYRALLFAGSLPDLGWILASVGVSMVVFAAGVLLFNKLESNFMDTV